MDGTINGLSLEEYKVEIRLSGPEPNIILGEINAAVSVSVHAESPTEAATKAVVSLFRAMSPHPRMSIDVRRVTKK